MSKRIVVNLRPDIPAEADFLDAYEMMPRRAEWVRRILLEAFYEERRRSADVIQRPSGNMVAKTRSVAETVGMPTMVAGATATRLVEGDA